MEKANPVSLEAMWGNGSSSEPPWSLRTACTVSFVSLSRFNIQPLVFHIQRAVRPLNNDSRLLHFNFKSSQTLQDGICNPGVARFFFFFLICDLLAFLMATKIHLVTADFTLHCCGLAFSQKFWDGAIAQDGDLQILESWLWPMLFIFLVFWHLITQWAIRTQLLNTPLLPLVKILWVHSFIWYFVKVFHDWFQFCTSYLSSLAKLTRAEMT